MTEFRFIHVILNEVKNLTSETSKMRPLQKLQRHNVGTDVLGGPLFVAKLTGAHRGAPLPNTNSTS